MRGPHRAGSRPAPPPAHPGATMRVHRLSVDDAFRALHSRPEGLTAQEAERRRHDFGPNLVQRVKRPSGLRLLAGELTHLFAVVLWVAAGLALVAELSEPGQEMGTLAAAILAVIVINAVFSFWQAHRAERALQALERLLPARVQAVRAARPLELEAAELVPGDLLLLEGGDRVPADCRIVEAVGLRLNVATLTGESVAVPRDAAPSEAADPVGAANVALAGTLVVAGRGRALVVATGGHTELARIAHLAQAAPTVASPLQREIARVSRLVALLATGLGVLFFGFGLLLGLPLWQDVLFGVGILVANVPEGLLPTVTLALALASQRMAARRALVRHLPAVEALGAASTICTDKTGTLTRNEMAPRALFLAGRRHDVGDDGSVPDAARSLPLFFEALLHCEDVLEEVGGHPHEVRGDPMEVALLELARRAGSGPVTGRRVHELPFDPGRRRLTVLHRTSAGLRVYTKGALEALLPLCDRWVGAAGEALLDGEARRTLLAAEDAMATVGLRVIAVAARQAAEPWSPESLEVGLVLLGLVGLEDPPRPDVAEAVARCREAGVRVIMVTGDHPRTAVAIGRRIGLLTTEAPRVVTGDRLAHLSDTQLQLALDAPEILFARATAEQKTRVVQVLQRKGEVVAVTGDGVNDAPALRIADIGVAMGRSGTDVAREASDVVLADDHFATIVQAVEEGRSVYANLRKFLTYILTSNIPEIVPYLAFVLLGIPLPLTVVQILAVDLGTDMLPALALGADPPDPDVMRRPPRSPRERLLNRPLLTRAYLWLGMLEAAAALAAYFFVLFRGGWQWGEPLARLDPLYLRATTACLAAIVAMQVANVFVCRSERGSVFRPGTRPNPALYAAIAAELGLLALIVYTPPGQRVFGTAPLDVATWAFIAAWPLAMLLLEELRKALVRRAALGGHDECGRQDSNLHGLPASRF